MLDSRLAIGAPVADAVCPFVEGIDQRFPLLRSIVDASIVAASAQLVAGSAGIGPVSGSRGGAVSLDDIRPLRPSSTRRLCCATSSGPVAGRGLLSRPCVRQAPT